MRRPPWLRPPARRSSSVRFPFPSSASARCAPTRVATTCWTPGDRRQLRASLALTRYLQSKYGINTRNVIGHAESLTSPYHHERVRRLRNQTHGDLGRSAMKRYRRAL